MSAGNSLQKSKRKFRMTYSADINELKIVRLSKVYNLSQFDCGDSDLNEFIKNDSFNYEKNRLALTFLIIYQETVIGFFSLVNDAIRLKEDEKTDGCVKNLPQYPAVKIARLAVHKSMQRKGVGTTIVKTAVGLILECRHSACRFITVDAYLSSEKFYRKLGFIHNLHRKHTKDDYESLRFDILNDSRG